MLRGREPQNERPDPKHGHGLRAIRRFGGRKSTVRLLAPTDHRGQQSVSPARMAKPDTELAKATLAASLTSHADCGIGLLMGSPFPDRTTLGALDTITMTMCAWGWLRSSMLPADASAKRERSSLYLCPGARRSK